jgi:hypothetical protein
MMKRGGRAKVRDRKIQDRKIRSQTFTLEDLRFEGFKIDSFQKPRLVAFHERANDPLHLSHARARDTRHAPAKIDARRTRRA